MAENLLDNTFYIQSKYLKMVESSMTQYFDYDSSMLIDDIESVVKRKCKLGDYIFPNEKGIPTIDYLRCFYNNESLIFLDSEYSHKKGIEKETSYIDIGDRFPDYFDFNIKDEAVLKDHYRIYLSLSYMAYIYYKQKKGRFNDISHPYILGLDIEYQSVLHQKIYPEMLSLYKMILDSKKRHKKQGDVITVNYKGDKLDINASGWFIDEMENLLQDRFPDVTLENIDELLPQPQKAGRKSKDPYIMIMVWGTYQLMKNHHSAFKNSNVKISSELCQFILDYFECQSIENDLLLIDVKDNLKDMLKRGYAPKWNLPWRNVFSNIQDKQPESKLGKLNQPSRKYNLSNLL